MALVLLRLFDYYHSNSHLTGKFGAQGRDLISRDWTKGGKRVEDSNVMLDRGRRARPNPSLSRRPTPGGEVIVVGAPQQGPDPSFIAYRQAIEIAEGARQRAIAAALADCRRALEDIETAYRRELAAARCRYSQGITGQRAAQAAA